MDRALDEVIGERQKAKQGGQNRRRNEWPHGSSRKVIPPHFLPTNERDDRGRLDEDWIHDRYDDEDDYGSQPMPRYARNRRRDRGSTEPDLFDKSVKLRVENVHYDLTEDDLRDLFNRIAPITSLHLSYDRAGRSLGTAYVTYRSMAPAREAIREFDGANANGQPIRLTLLPTGPAADRAGGRASAPRNPFDTAVRPGRSLFERIERKDESGSRNKDTRRDGKDRRDRSRSPGARRTNTRKPPPEGVDRYVPGEEGGERSRSPPRRRGNGGRGAGARRGEARRGGVGGGAAKGAGRDEPGRPIVQGRPRFTAEELDKDMDDYWGAKNDANGDTTGTTATTNETAAPNLNQAATGAPMEPVLQRGDDGDIDMAE